MIQGRKSTIAFAVAAVAGTVSAQGVEENSDVAKKFLDQATPIQGKYNIQAKHNSHNMLYTYLDKNEIQLTPHTPQTLLEQIAEDIEHAFASDAWTFTPNPNGDGSTSICIEDECKCLATQWDFGTAKDSIGQGGFDHFGVASPAVIGTVGSTNCPDPGTGMTPDKQHLVFLKVGGSDDSSAASGKKDFAAVDDTTIADTVSNTTHASIHSSHAAPTSSADSSSETAAGCPKPADWVYRHANAEYLRVHPECKGTGSAPKCTKDKTWLEAHKSYISIHPECESTLKAKRDMEKVAKREVVERDEDYSGDYVIVVYDHLTDMATKMVSANEVLSFDDLKSAELIDYDAGSPVVWTVSKA